MDSLLRNAIMTFVSLLRSGWHQAFELGKLVPGRDPFDFVSDWAQASWEMLVEAAVSPGGDIFLEPYGEGADCNDVGSRVWRPGETSTHAVHIVPLRGRVLHDLLADAAFELPEKGIAMDQFVTLSEEGWYRPEPPFDHVLIWKNGSERVVSLAETDFLLVDLD